nr:hypothetical protein [Tanacetum cinerariifolium]
MKAKRKLVPKCPGMVDGTPGTHMRGVHITTSYVLKNVDIVGEAVDGVISSKRQCRVRIVAGDILDENISTGNMNGSKIQPQLRRHCIRQSNRLGDSGDVSASGVVFASTVVPIDNTDQRKKMLAAKRAEEKRNKLPTQAQQRTYMSNYIKNMRGYTLKQLKKYYFEEIKMLFDRTIESIRKFVPMESEG